MFDRTESRGIEQLGSKHKQIFLNGAHVSGTFRNSTVAGCVPPSNLKAGIFSLFTDTIVSVYFLCSFKVIQTSGSLVPTT